MNKIKALQDKAVQTINFRANNYVRELYKIDKILIISDYIKLLFVRNVLLNLSIPHFIKNQKIYINTTLDTPTKLCHTNLTEY